jgi:hypothetical protein
VWLGPRGVPGTRGARAPPTPPLRSLDCSTVPPFHRKETPRVAAAGRGQAGAGGGASVVARGRSMDWRSTRSVAGRVDASESQCLTCRRRPQRGPGWREPSVTRSQKFVSGNRYACDGRHASPSLVSLCALAHVWGISSQRIPHLVTRGTGTRVMLASASPTAPISAGCLSQGGAPQGAVSPQLDRGPSG